MKLSPSQRIDMRVASEDDLDVLVNFGATMAKETEARELDRVRLRQGILAVLQSSTHGYYLVCDLHDGQGSRNVIGQMLITYEWSDWRNATFWWIQSVYVHPEWRRQGVYRRMHEYIVRSARERPDVCGVRLYVEAENIVAQTAYKRMGMSASHYRMYERDFIFDPS